MAQKTETNPRGRGKNKSQDPCETMYLWVRSSAVNFILSRMSKRAMKEEMVNAFERLYEQEKLKELQEKMGV